ncbi:MAG TPA: phosphatase PAP2 family protein [Acidimicrobiales bacterium]|jgi:undecaprenyl-diphosphatase|nr:phosphatase PAP2 family protein [Acidimicrobiales bacterium]
MKKFAPPDHWAEPVRRFDRAAERHFGRLRGHPVVDRVMYGASELGDFGLVWHLVGAVQAFRSDRDFVRAVRLSAVLGVESVIVNGGVKSLFQRSRPVHEGERPHRLRQPLTSSFPSGHASAAACAAVLLADDDPLSPLWVAMAVVVGTSRAHVRIHHPSDVVAGAAIGTAIGLVARRLWPLPG